jgi:hypothetical protein
LESQEQSLALLDYYCQQKYNGDKVQKKSNNPEFLFFVHKKVKPKKQQVIKTKKSNGLFPCGFTIKH